MVSKDVLEELVAVTFSEPNYSSADPIEMGVEQVANSNDLTENRHLFLPSFVDMLKQQEMEDAVKSILEEETSPNQENVYTLDKGITADTIMEQASLGDATANDEDNTLVCERLKVNQKEEEEETLKEDPEESCLHGEEKNKNSENSLMSTCPCDDSDNRDGWDKRKRNTSETEAKSAEKKSKTRDIDEKVNRFSL